MQKVDRSPVVRQKLSAQQSSVPVPPSTSASSAQSLAHGGVPELLLGLSYNATTGRLSVEVVKGSHFRNLAASRPPGLLDTRHVGQMLMRVSTRG